MIISKRLALSLLCSVPLTLCAAATPSLEERVRALETKLVQLSEENTTLKKQLGLEGKAAPAFVTAAGREKSLSIGGYLQGHAEFGDAPDARFVAGDRIYLRRARLTLKGAFAEHFGFGLQSDLGSNSAGAVSGNRAQATDAFIVWNRHPAASVTLGQFKTPYGYEQLLPRYQAARERAVAAQRPAHAQPPSGSPTPPASSTAPASTPARTTTINSSTWAA